MKRLSLPIAAVLTALILTGGFFLPTVVLQYKDRQTVGRLTVTDGSGVSYETKSELKVIDRLNMFTYAKPIGVDNGNNMNADKAFQSAMTELDTFADKGIIELNRADCRLSSYDVYFLIDSTDPTRNMIVWYLLIKNETHDIYVTVDDETGVLLAMDYNLNEVGYKMAMTASPKPAITEAYGIELEVGEKADDATVTELIGQTLADYYGLSLVGSEPLKSDYYTRLAFELSDGRESVTLYVTLTGTGFMVST
jgi:hypothetical protein